MVKHSKGDTFVREKTGSATMINLDGRWEHNFVDDNTPAGDKPVEKNRPAVKKKN